MLQPEIPLLIIAKRNKQNALYLYNMAAAIKPIFNKRIFWDVVFENIDYDAKANFVIERVFERGDVEDIRNCRRYYGDEKVTEALLNAKFLPLHTTYLASAVINKPLKDFRCYNLRQLNPTLFPY
jgi:nicotinamide mononucleotide adenylyltransferase